MVFINQFRIISIMYKQHQHPTKALDQLTPIMIKSIRQNPKFCQLVSKICKNIHLNQRDYNSIKNHSNIQKVIQFYCESISYHKNLLNQLVYKQKQLKKRIKEKQNNFEIQHQAVSFQRKKIIEREEKVNQQIKTVLKYKGKVKRNNQSFNNVTHLHRKNSYQQNTSSFMVPMEFYDMRNNNPQMMGQYSDWMPTNRNRNNSTFTNNQKEQLSINNSDYKSEQQMAKNNKNNLVDSKNIQEIKIQINGNELNNTTVSQKLKNRKMRTIQQSTIQINTKQIQVSHQLQERNQSPVKIEACLDNSFELEQQSKIKKSQKREQVTTVKKVNKIQKLSYNIQDSQMIKKDVKMNKLTTPPRLLDNNSTYQQSPSEEKREQSPIQVENIDIDDEDDLINSIPIQSIKKPSPAQNKKLTLKKRVFNQTQDSLIAFKGNFHKNSNDPTLAQSLQLKQSIDSQEIIKANQKSNAKYYSNQHIQEQSDKSQDLRSTVNDNNVRRKMIQLIKRYQLTLTTRQNLLSIEKQIQQQYSLSQGWKQEIDFWRGIIDRFEGEGKKQMRIQLAELSESLAIKNSAISRANNLRASQTFSRPISRNKKRVQDRLTISQKGIN